MTFDMTTYRGLALRTESPVVDETKYRLVRAYELLEDALSDTAELGKLLDRLKRYAFYLKDDKELTDQLMPAYPTGEKRERIEQCARLLHFVIGLAGEVGEITEELHEFIETGKPMNKANMRGEGGDVLWYLNGYLDVFGLSVPEVGGMNIDKLKIRYKDKFTTDEAINRDATQEIAVHAEPTWDDDRLKVYQSPQ